MNKTVIAKIVIIIVIIIGGIVFFSGSFNQSEQRGILIQVQDSNGANEIADQEYTDIQTDEDIFLAIDDTLNYIE